MSECFVCMCTECLRGEKGTSDPLEVSYCHADTGPKLSPLQVQVLLLFTKRFSSQSSLFVLFLTQA